MIERATRLEDVARPGGRIGHRIEVHAAIGSTNDRAAELLRAGDEGTAVVAEVQTSGRGRRGRSWVSPAGVNLTVSVGVRPRLAAADAWRLGLAVALAARTACEPVAAIAVKWPNDVVATDDSKVGGVLVETTITADRLNTAVIGIGINVNWRSSDMPPEIAGGATSLADLCGRAVDRATLLGRLLTALEREVEWLEAGESPLERYRDACSTLGRPVEVRAGDRIVAGTAVGLTPKGGLVVETAGGPVSFDTGEVTQVRPATRT